MREGENAVVSAVGEGCPRALMPWGDPLVLALGIGQGYFRVICAVWIVDTPAAFSTLK